MTDASDREKFCAQMYTAPIAKADAVVVLCGEDHAPRVSTGVELVNSRCAPYLVLSGGREAPPLVRGAASLAPDVLGMGVAPDHLIIEDTSQNTLEQAERVLDTAVSNDWKRLLLVCSAYHAPRVMLTFIAQAHRQHANIHFIAVPSVGHWSDLVGSATRLQLLTHEFRKIEQYQHTRDCATYAAGLKYLRYTEGR